MLHQNNEPFKRQLINILYFRRISTQPPKSPIKMNYNHEKEIINR